MHRRTEVIDDRAFAAIDAMLDDGFCLCAIVADADGRPVDYRFLRVSRTFEAVTGLAGAEGRTALELAPEMDPGWIETFGRVALGRESARVLQGRRTPDSDQVFEVFAAPVDPPGCFAMTFRDVTALRRAEAEREAALEAAQTLLRELNHRVMNSFAAISAIAAMETRAAPAEAQAPLRRLQGRVQALGALYRRLEGAARADRIDAAEYLGGVGAAFAESIGGGSGVAVEARLAPLVLPTRAAVPLGLVVNEVLTAAVRQTAPVPARVSLRLTAEAGEGRLLVEHEGALVGEECGVGRGLVAAFVGELGGTIEVETGPGGTRTALRFPLPEA